MRQEETRWRSDGSLQIIRGDSSAHEGVIHIEWLLLLIKLKKMERLGVSFH